MLWSEGCKRVTLTSYAIRLQTKRPGRSLIQVNNETCTCGLWCGVAFVIEATHRSAGVQGQAISLAVLQPIDRLDRKRCDDVGGLNRIRDWVLIGIERIRSPYSDKLHRNHTPGGTIAGRVRIRWCRTRQNNVAVGEI